MPSARSHTAAAESHTSRARQATARPAPRRVSSRLPVSKVRWDRKFRAVMIGVFLLVGWIGIGAGHSLLSTRAQAAGEQALVAKLAKQNRELQREKASLSQPATIKRDARALGMVGRGERPFVVTGLSGR